MHQNLRAVNLRCMVFQVECTLPHNSNNSHNRLTQTNSLLFSTGWVEFLPKECLWEWGLPISQDSCNNNNRQVYRRVILSLKCCVMERVCNCDHSSEAATQFLYMYVVRIFLSWHSCSVSCYQWVNAAMTKDKVYKEIILYSIEGSCKNLDSFCCVSPSELLYICAQLLKWPSKLLFGDIPVHVFIPVLHLICFLFCLTSLLLMYRSPRFNSKCSRCGSNNRCPNKWTCTVQALACLDLLRHQWQMAGCHSNPCHFPSSNILSLSPQDLCLGTWDLEISPWGLYLAQAKLSVTSCGNNEVVLNM